MKVLSGLKLAVSGGALVLLAQAGFAGGASGGGRIAFGAPGSAGALGGSYASRGVARPLGGISGPENRGAAHGYYRTPRYYAVPVFPYAYSWYVPSYFDSVDPYAGLPSYPSYPPEAAAAAPPSQPPVIINQYFSGGQPAPAAGPPPASPSASAGSGAPLAPVDNYYLIAYKDHRVYPVISWWIEGNVLNYVTLENMHNQASLDLIDLSLTRTLNQPRNIPFSLAQGQ